LSLKNFNGIFAIMSGLQHPSVERLSQTWSGLRPQVKEQLKALKQLTSKDDHFKTYREKLEASVPPCVPHLDIFLEELSYIDSFNPDIGKGGVINFAKHRRLARIIRTLEQYSAASYSDVTPLQSIIDFLLHSSVLDDDNLQKLSLNCEPPSNFG